ncbi:MAG: hypothetical protein E7H84_09040 [Bifidobacterium breve]|nr:hypothetical protein [Bifidobacterium breve]
MAELSDNVRWLVTTLIDKDQRIGVELQRRGEEYAAAGRPRDGSCLCSMVLRPVERLVFSPKER